MVPDLWSLYRQMKLSRLVEEAVTELWDAGLISGEMHLGTGEEAIVAGVLAHISEDDALALDHRGTPSLVMRGVDPLLILRELLGHPDGLGKGQGGHMHLFAKDYLAASSGIVGAAGPTAAGFALAGQLLRPGSVTVAFFGEGALNQGMLMEAMNLASVWRLPILFVCKDDAWSITAESQRWTGATPAARAEGFGLTYIEVDGLDVVAVWEAAQAAVQALRAGGPPVFLHAHCVHIEAHFLGYAALRAIRRPLQELPAMVGPLLRSALHPRGGSMRDRLRGITAITRALLEIARDPRGVPTQDPVVRTRRLLKANPERLTQLEHEISQQVDSVVSAALEERTL